MLFELLHERRTDGRPVDFLTVNEGLLQAGMVVQREDSRLPAHMRAALSKRIGGIAFYFDGAAIPNFCQDGLKNLPIKEGRSIVIGNTWDVFGRLFYIREGIFDGCFFAGGEDRRANGDAA